MIVGTREDDKRFIAQAKCFKPVKDPSDAHIHRCHGGEVPGEDVAVPAVLGAKRSGPRVDCVLRARCERTGRVSIGDLCRMVANSRTVRRGVPDLEVERRCVGPTGNHRTALKELKCVVGDRIREVVGFLIKDPIADHRFAVLRASAKLVCVPMAEPEARCLAVSQVPLA